MSEEWWLFPGGREELERRIVEGWDYIAGVEYLNAWVQYGWDVDPDVAFRALTLMVFRLHQGHHL